MLLLKMKLDQGCVVCYCYSFPSCIAYVLLVLTILWQTVWIPSNFTKNVLSATLKIHSIQKSYSEYWTSPTWEQITQSKHHPIRKKCFWDRCGLSMQTCWKAGLILTARVVEAIERLRQWHPVWKNSDKMIRTYRFISFLDTRFFEIKC